MALSETFNLDFKFGGNAEFLTKLEKLIERVDARFNSVENNIKDTAAATNKMSEATNKMSGTTDKMSKSVMHLNGSLKENNKEIKEMSDGFGNLMKYYMEFQMVTSGVRKIWDFGMGSMNAFSTQERAENQLKAVMTNRGTVKNFDVIKDYAADIQNRSIYGDEAMIKGAGELATYVKGTSALKKMMDLLTNYAAGMTGGGAVAPEQMESLATGLGMAYDGNYMAMRRKGFDTSKLEALDAITENGGKWGAKEKAKYGDVLDDKMLAKIRELKGVTEEMRVDALKESLKDWDNLSDAVNNLHSSALVKLQNKLGDLREEVGKNIYPTFNALVATIDTNMPKIQAFFETASNMFNTIAKSLNDNFDSLMQIASNFMGIVPVLIEKGFLLINIFDKLVFEFAGFKEVLIGLGAAFAAGKVLEYKDSIISISLSLKKFASNAWRTSRIMARHSVIMKQVGISTRTAAFSFRESALIFSRSLAQMTVTMMKSIRVGLNRALSGATAQMLLFAAATWSVAKILDAAKAVMELFGEKKKAEMRDEIDEGSGYNEAVEIRAKTSEKTGKYKRKLEEFRKNNGYVEGKGYSNEYLTLQDKMLEEQYLNAKKDSDNALENVRKTGSERQELYKELYGSVGANASEEDEVQKQIQELQKEAKVEMHQTFNTTNNNIEQKVNVAADVEKIGMLLNFSVRSAIESAMRLNKRTAFVGEM